MARSEAETKKILENAKQGGFKIILCTQSLHVVGLEALPNGNWQMVGNGLPTKDELTSEEVFHYLHLSKTSKKRRKESNIYIFPSLK